MQCAKCPWKTSTDPETIPHGYSRQLHETLKRTIAEGPVESLFREPRKMACHESPVGAERACTGWLANQLGPGNNITVRMEYMDGLYGEIVLDGDQHETFEETLGHA